jgi:hypothetical protein
VYAVEQDEHPLAGEVRTKYGSKLVDRARQGLLGAEVA